MPSSEVSADWVPWAPGRDQQDPNDPVLLTEGDSLLVTFGFHCNLACTFCLVEDGLDNFKGISVQQLEAWLTRPSLFRGVRRITLSGGEATMEKELFEYVRLARRVPGVEHVRIQTNGTRLGNREYLSSLIDAGVDELFISLHAHDEALNTKITLRKGSFKQIVAGIEAVAASRATLLVNTAIVTDNHEHLAEILEVSAPFRPACHSFWYNFLRVDRPDTRLMMPKMEAVIPHLTRALDRGDALGVTTSVKWVPRCLLGKHEAKQDDSQPTTLVEEAFWKAAPESGCLYRGSCSMGRECTGLPYPYVETYGWEEDLLRPRLLVERKKGNHTTPLALSPDERTRADAILSALGLGRGVDVDGWRAEAPTRMGDALRVPVVKNGAMHWIELGRVDPAKRYLAKGKTLALSYGKPEAGMENAFRALLESVKSKLEAWDTGGARLPWWQG